MQEMEEMKIFCLSPNIAPIIVDSNLLVSLIKKSPSLRKTGLDKFRYEHLRQLIGPQLPERVVAEDNRFVELHAGVLQLLLNGDVPDEALPLFREHEAWVISKGTYSDAGRPEFRPLGGVGVHRKLAATIALRDFST